MNEYKQRENTPIPNKCIPSNPNTYTSWYGDLW